MLRSVTLIVALSLLATACALVEQPVPPGAIEVQVRVRNARAHPVELEVWTPAGVLPGAVRPASLLTHAMTDVTFYVPISGRWSIVADGEQIVDTDVGADLARHSCPFGIELAADGSHGYGCGLLTDP